MKIVFRAIPFAMMVLACSSHQRTSVPMEANNGRVRTVSICRLHVGDPVNSVKARLACSNLVVRDDDEHIEVRSPGQGLLVVAKLKRGEVSAILAGPGTATLELDGSYVGSWGELFDVKSLSNLEWLKSESGVDFYRSLDGSILWTKIDNGLLQNFGLTR